MIVRELIEALLRCDPAVEVWNGSDNSLVTSVIAITRHAGDDGFSHVRVF